VKTNTKNKGFLRVKKYPPARRYLSLFIIIGIFLLPNLARLSAITPENIIKLTNEERQKNRLPALVRNEELATAAYQKGQALIANREFAHNLAGRRFSDWIKDAGYKYSYVGENLALDFYTGEGVVAAWLDSPTHRKNLLNDSFKEIGVAVMEGDLGSGKSTIVVQVFGTPAAVPGQYSPVPAETPLANGQEQAGLPGDMRLNGAAAAGKGSFVSLWWQRGAKAVRQTVMDAAFAYQGMYQAQRGYFLVLNFWLLWLAALLLVGPDTISKLRKQRYIIG
jgi:hypothetical protein